MSRVEVYCYYSISNGDSNSFAIRIGNKEYCEKVDTVDFKEKCEKSLELIESLVGKSFDLYCNEVDSVNLALKDKLAVKAQGIFSQSPRYAKELKELVLRGKVQGRYNKEEIERGIRESIIAQHNYNLQTVSAVKSDAKYIETAQFEKARTDYEVKQQRKEDRIRQLEMEMGLIEEPIKEVSSYDLYLGWSKGVSATGGFEVKCACVSQDLKIQYGKTFIENTKLRGSSKPKFLQDILYTVIERNSDNYKKFKIYVDIDTVMRSIERPRNSMFKCMYDDINSAIETLKNNGIDIDFAVVTYNREFRYKKVRSAILKLIK